AGSAPGGSAGEGGSGGGSEPTCSAPCGANAECVVSGEKASCVCVSGFVLDGSACRRPRSCAELHRNAPGLPSGSYTLQPGADALLGYCEMIEEGGGWTLVLNEGTTFDPMGAGTADALCYSASCTSAAYSRVLLEADVLLDVSNAPIVGANYAARVLISGVHAMTRGKTVRALFTSGPNFLEAENNSNLVVRMSGNADCASTLPRDFAALVCETCNTAGCKVPAIVFGDTDSATECRPGSPVPHFAIGANYDYVTAWNNCAGWPQDPNYVATDFYPDHFRVWIR
ncbi:MAG TPA: fibrinogen-like YCDxxxxGGGW domain-containing protein, partial [Polyangiaceae bacterium]